MKNADREHIVYQVWPRSFYDANGDGIGDLRGVTEKLDYIKSLGVDLIWLNPVYASPNQDYGYDVSDYYTIHPDFGTMEDFNTLLAEAKARDLGILMDFVPNHTSNQHPWFQAALADENSPTRDYYYFRDGKNGGAPNNWLGFFGGSAWQKDEKSGQYYLASFAPTQCDLNWKNPALRQELYSMLRFWLDKGVAGFRIDVVNALDKADGLPDKDPEKKGLQFPAELVCDRPGMHALLQELNREVFSRYDCFTVGEGVLTNEDSVVGHTRDSAGELMMMFQFDLAGVGCGPLGKYDFRKLYRWSISDLKHIVDSWQEKLQAGGGWLGNYLSNHDQPRQVSRFGNDGKYRTESACALALFNLTMRGTPFLYQGEECGMTNCRLEMEEWKDYEAINMYSVLQSMMHLPAFLAEHIVKLVTRDHSRTPVQWDSSSNAGFTAGTPWMKVNPNYTEVNIAAESREGGVVDFYKKAIALRKAHSKTFTYGSYAPVDAKNPRVLSYLRELPEEGEKLLVAVNLSKRPASVLLPAGNGECLLGTHGKRSYEEKLYLAPYEGAAFRLE